MSDLTGKRSERAFNSGDKKRKAYNFSTFYVLESRQEEKDKETTQRISEGDGRM
jgi:hypothetical protein